MSSNESHYGTYDANSSVYRPISERLIVNAGEGTKARPSRNATAQMTAPPSFIKRFKATKVGRKVDHVDGIQADSFAEFADEEDSLNGLERHIGQMLMDDNQDAWDEFG